MFLIVGVEFIDKQERKLEYPCGKALELGILVKN